MNPEKVIVHSVAPENMGKFGLYLRNGKVSFDYDCLFDPEIPKREKFYGTFGIDDYGKGIDELLSIGKCHIDGYGCWMDIRRSPLNMARVDICFTLKKSNSYDYGICIRHSTDFPGWHVEDLKIK